MLPLDPAVEKGKLEEAVAVPAEAAVNAVLVGLLCWMLVATALELGMETDRVLVTDTVGCPVLEPTGVIVLWASDVCPVVVEGLDDPSDGISEDEKDVAMGAEEDTIEVMSDDAEESATALELDETRIEVDEDPTAAVEAGIEEADVGEAPVDTLVMAADVLNTAFVEVGY